LINVPVINPRVFSPDAKNYKLFKLGKRVFILFEFLIYPYVATKYFPNGVLPIMILVQLVFIVDIVLNFFKAVRLEEDSKVLNDKADQIAKSYLSSNFLTDFILMLPLGYFGEMVHPQLKILHFIKLFRLQEILESA